jgi:hypothetical protein
MKAARCSAFNLLGVDAMLARHTMVTGIHTGLTS